MPPRRSSRAGSAAAEVTTETLPAKRKRGQATQSKPETNEDFAKPSSTRRTPATKGRAASGTKSSLPDVPESDGEGESDAAPAKKKSRPSIENEGSDAGEDDEDGAEGKEDVVPKGKARGTTSRRTKEATMDVDDSRELPKRRASSRQPSVASGRRSSAAPSRPARATRVSSIAESVVKEEEEAEEVKPKRTRRTVKKEVISDDDDAQAESDHEDSDAPKPQPKGRKSKAPARQTKPASKKAPQRVVLVESDEEEASPPPPAQAGSSRPKEDHEKSNEAEISAAPKEPEEQAEEEEEKSLFDPPPMPDPSMLPQTMPEEPAGPKPRLVIHKMALVNFKSYAGRQEIGPFHKSFSAIVGPNGSGKSNTIDALLFVFGYRASKMRQGKVSELIHNSARHPDLDECSVEVHFRDIIDLPGADAFEVVPNSKLVVTRTAYKNNQSKYTINGKGATYKEVQTLLKGRGIDLDHNRFLILQGEVESIAQMKPKAQTEHEDGLLEYLEDIIGTSKYKEPIEEALIEMERIQEERQAKLNRLRLVEKEKAALEEKRREAINFFKMKNDHIRAQSRYFQWLIWRLLKQQDVLEEGRNKVQVDLAKEQKNNEVEVKYLEELQDHYAKKEENFEKVKKATATAIKDLKETEKKVVGLQERQKHAAGRSKKLVKSIQEDTSNLKKAKNEIEDSTEKLEKEKAALENHESSLIQAERALEAIQEGLRDKTQVFHDQIQAKQQELQPWTAKINAKQAEIDVAQSERDALAKRAQAVKESLQEAEETFNALESEQQAKVKEQAQFKLTKEKLKQDFAAATQRNENAQRNLAEWRSKAASSRNRFEEARANQSASRSQGTVIETLSNLKRQGRIHGFHGKLGSLGTIDDKYDVAISTACGGGLNNLVVDKVEQGKACIEYLRTNNLGRASFIILDKLNESRGMNPIQTPEGVPRLFDLVKPKDPVYRKAFYKVLTDTLVANDMEQANRIAFGGTRRWRVVTLSGQVIEVSGAMSGGGSQPMRGAMSSKLAADGVRPEVLREYEQDNQKCAEQLQKASEEAQAAETDLALLTKAGPDLDMAYQKLTLEIETRKSRIAEAAKHVKDLRSQSKPNAGDIARIEQLEDEIASSTSALEKLQRGAAKITQAIADLEKQILEIGGAKLMKQKSAVDGLRTFIAISNDEITKAETAKSKAEKDVKRLTTAIATNKAQSEEVTAELDELNTQVAKETGYLEDLQQTVEEAQTEVENQKETLDELKKDLDAKEAGIAKFRKREMELQQSLNDVQKELVNVEASIEKYQGDHDRLELHDIEDEEEESDDEDESRSTPATTEDGADASVKPDPDQPLPKKNNSELKMYTENELKQFRKDELIADTELLDEKINNAKVDLSVLKEYKEREAEFDNRAKDVELVTAQRDAQKAAYDGLRKQRLDEFMAGFNLISLKLKEMYQMITLGGNAELELVDSLDPFSEGIIFSVMPPKKSWKNISNLSGGEKTLSSLALVFALHVFKPTPLYFMDEIDAALDFRNVSIVANYIKDRTKNAQFIIISLRNDMFELSHRLIGIYKTANATRSISINNHRLLANVPPPATTANA